MTESQYQFLKNRLTNDHEFNRLFLESLRQYILSKIGELLIDFIWWTLSKLFNYGRFLVWPLFLYLEAKGYINSSDGILKIIKDAIK